jgi:hypothetical protein
MHLKHNRTRHVRQEIVEILRAFVQGGLTANDARTAVDNVIDATINEAITDTLREINGSD